MWYAAAFILVGLSFGYGVYLYRKRRAREFFRGRERLSEDEIFFRFYKDTDFTKQDVLDVWKEVAEVFKLPFGVLRPSDRFGKELRGYWLVDTEVDELSDRAHDRLKKKGKSVDLHKISSLDEYVRMMLAALIDADGSDAG